MWDRLRLKTLRTSALISLGLSLLVGALYGIHVFAPFDGKVRDFFLRLRGPSPLIDDIVLILVDTKSENELEAWPFPREYHAALINGLTRAGARTIAMDVLFFDPAKPETDALFAEVLRTTGNVFLPAIPYPPGPQRRNADLAQPQIRLKPEDYPSEAVADRGNLRTYPLGVPSADGFYTIADLHGPMPAIAGAVAGVGHAMAIPDSDGTIRRVPPFVEYQGAFIPHFALLASLHQLGASMSDVSFPRRHRMEIAPPNGAKIRVPLDLRRQMMVNYTTGLGNITSYSYSDVLRALADPEGSSLHPEIFNNKLVFIGSYTSADTDLHPSPLDAAIPGVLINAWVAHTLLTDSALRAPRRGETLLLTLLFGTLAGPILALTRARLAALIVPLFFVLFYAGAFALFAQFRVTLDMLPPTLSLLAASVAGLSLAFIGEQQARMRLRSTLGQYFSPSLMEEIARADTTEVAVAQKKDISVIFADMVGFTPLSERLSPEELVEIVNEFFAYAAEIIERHGGTVDKFMGDAVMAIVGAPISRNDHAQRALAIAREMIAKTREIRHAWRQRDREFPELSVGIASGFSMVGSIGSQNYKEYTALGRVVNLASRIEGTAAASEIRVSEKTFSLLGDPPFAEEIGNIELKGLGEKYRIFRIRPSEV